MNPWIPFLNLSNKCRAWRKISFFLQTKYGGRSFFLEETQPKKWQTVYNLGIVDDSFL